MNTTRTIPFRHVVDVRLAIVAGLVAGTVFLALNLLFCLFYYHVSGWAVFQYLSSIILGPGVLPPPSSFAPGVFIVGLIVNYVLAVLYSLLLALIIHRFGLLVGIFGGALYGAAFYFINFYTFTLFFPWLFALAGIPLFLSHIAFGVTAGTIYELFDFDDSGFGTQGASL